MQNKQKFYQNTKRNKKKIKKNISTSIRFAPSIQNVILTF